VRVEVWSLPAASAGGVPQLLCIGDTVVRGQCASPTNGASTSATASASSSSGGGFGALGDTSDAPWPYFMVAPTPMQVPLRSARGGGGRAGCLHAYLAVHKPHTQPEAHLRQQRSARRARRSSACSRTRSSSTLDAPATADQVEPGTSVGGGAVEVVSGVLGVPTEGGTVGHSLRPLERQGSGKAYVDDWEVEDTQGGDSSAPAPGGSTTGRAGDGVEGEAEGEVDQGYDSEHYDALSPRSSDAGEGGEEEPGGDSIEKLRKVRERGRLCVYGEGLGRGRQEDQTPASLHSSPPTPTPASLPPFFFLSHCILPSVGCHARLVHPGSTRSVRSWRSESGKRRRLVWRNWIGVVAQRDRQTHTQPYAPASKQCEDRSHIV
jgi:hypothetical protein